MRSQNADALEWCR